MNGTLVSGSSFGASNDKNLNGTLVSASAFGASNDKQALLGASKMSNVHDEYEITNALPAGEKGESITINDKTFTY